MQLIVLKIMKKILTLSAVFLLSAMTIACADDARPIAYEQLPAAAKQFITTYFPDAKVALATVESPRWRPTYEVVFADGTEIDFKGSGEWKDVDCKRAQVPDGVIPAKMLEFVRLNHADNFIVEITRDRREYEIKLNNGIELRFSPDGQFRRYDD